MDDGHGEVPAVPTGRVEPKPGRPEHADGDKGEGLESDGRRLLGELIDTDIASSEYREMP
jgi:hypothetical protein